ncbi:hypothetical protein NONI108955_05180 [Nocardia ninae]|uniref:Nucleotidyl transferase AbiEii toxin, Type IV TA system n=1 Tax=Nocardia ninae NBRC 108245 TaxID=1210091 RepID=A0A511MAG1_9NOCA|nr:hypothetical protein [Nocardia ninae]GEM37569.1 hypothetical protein NN4_20880 [Nocardia ninae NBRC 108245]
MEPRHRKLAEIALAVAGDQGFALAGGYAIRADWRAHPPVLLDIGTVLHPDDAVANKMCALYRRALPRDFLSVGTALTSGRYSRDRLSSLTKSADDGSEPRMFAHALGTLMQITDEAFAEYRTSDLIAAMRGWVTDWRREFQTR